MTPRDIDRLELALRSGLGVAVAVLLSATAVICFLEVLLRYLFASGLSWYDELVGYLLVWITFLSAVLAQSHGQHIGMGELMERAPERVRKAGALLGHLVIFAVHLVLLVYGGQLALRFLGENAVTLPVPMGMIYGVIPVSAALMLVVEAIRFLRFLRT